MDRINMTDIVLEYQEVEKYILGNSLIQVREFSLLWDAALDSGNTSEAIKMEQQSRHVQEKYCMQLTMNK